MNVAKNTSIRGMYLYKDEPIPRVVLSLEDGDEVIISKIFFDKFNFKIGDEVTIAISDTCKGTITNEN